MQTVLLRHDLPDGSRHLDWLIARRDPPGDADARTLLTFRTNLNPWATGVVRFNATRLADHRVAYLTYEGPVSGGRGTVARIGEGVATLARADAGLDEAIDVAIELPGAGRTRLRGRRDTTLGPDRWVFETIDRPPGR